MTNFIKKIFSSSIKKDPEPKISWLEKMQKGLKSSANDLSEKIYNVLYKKKIDENTKQELKNALLQADLGINVTKKIIHVLESHVYEKELELSHARLLISSEIEKILDPVAKPFEIKGSAHKPHVILVVGVNGTGKTTTIGKITAKLQKEGMSVMLVGADTFRAAAFEQLSVWSERTSSTLFLPEKMGTDPASLSYDAFCKAKEENYDVLIIDTAGRLQNRTELMDELAKIVRTLKKLNPDAPHTILQTIDATTGQNALDQVEIFHNIAGVNGLIITKLDATKRAGILIAVADKYKIPIHFIGVGENLEDLEAFSAKDFAKIISSAD